MKKVLFALAFTCASLFAFSHEIVPESDENPLDTLKVYYLDEFVVSSSVKETNELRSLPTAVSVISPRQLQDKRIESLPRLSAYVPNFFIPSYGSKVSTPIYIRGVGARLGSQTVSLYVDNVPSFNPSAFDFEFQDIQRIEVLRGAQGTLYGRNAIGGIINMYTLSPLTYQGTRLMVSGGNYGQFSAKGSNYSKLGDNFGLSLAGYYKRDDGYFMNNYTGEKVDDSENAGGKVKLEWQASPSFKAMLFGNYDYVSGGAFPYMHVDSTASSFNEPSSYDRHLFTNGLSLDYIGNSYSIHSTSGFQYLKDDMKMDQDYSPRSIFSIRQQQEQRSFSQEITVKSDLQRRYRWVVGMFGFIDHRKVDTPVALKEAAIAALQSRVDLAMAGLPMSIKFNNFQIGLPGIYTKPSRGMALFHQSTLDALFGVEELSATAGIRVDYEHTGIDFFTESEGAEITMTRPAKPDTVMNVNARMEGGYSKDFWEILPKFALKYQFSPTAQVYLSASKGYKSGGYNEQAFSEILQTELMKSFRLGSGGTEGMTLEEQLSYAPETSWTYELGGRYEILDHRLSLTYALFYSHVNNLQITKLVSEGNTGRTIANAGQSESKGFEVSLKYVPYDNLSFFAEYGLADARFVKYETEEVIGQDTVRSFAGNQVPFAPKHTLSVGASYVHHLPYGSFIDRLVANVQYKGVGRIYWTESNKDASGQELYQPFYGLANASLAAEKGAFGLECWVENLFNTKYHSFLFEQEDVSTRQSNTFVQRGYPPRFGATLRYTFDR